MGVNALCVFACVCVCDGAVVAVVLDGMDGMAGMPYSGVGWRTKGGVGRIDDFCCGLVWSVARCVQIH